MIVIDTCEVCDEPIHYSPGLRKWYHDTLPRLQDSHQAVPSTDSIREEQS